MKKQYLITCLLFLIGVNIYAQSARIDQVKIEHNVTQNGQNGIKIYTTFNVSGMYNRPIEYEAFIYFADGSELLASRNSKYVAQNGNLMISTRLTPKYESTKFTDSSLFIPYSELSSILGQGKTELMFIIYITDIDYSILAESDEVKFSYTKSGNSNVNGKPDYMSPEEIQKAKEDGYQYIEDYVFDNNITNNNNNNNNNNTTNNNQITSTGSNVTASEAKAALDYHNQARAEVGVAPLSWSTELSQYAQEWADYLASNYNCSLEHRNDLKMNPRRAGENLFGGSSSYGLVYTALDASKKWYNEINNFSNYPIGSGREGVDVGHYTQMVWSKTTQVGFGVAKCSAGKYVIVANYNPAGNMGGEKAY